MRVGQQTGWRPDDIPWGPPSRMARRWYRYWVNWLLEIDSRVLMIDIGYWSRVGDSARRRLSSEATFGSPSYTADNHVYTIDHGTRHTINDLHAGVALHCSFQPSISPCNNYQHKPDVDKPSTRGLYWISVGSL